MNTVEPMPEMQAVTPPLLPTLTLPVSVSPRKTAHRLARLALDGLLVYCAVIFAYICRYTLFRFATDNDLPSVPFERYAGVGGAYAVLVALLVAARRYTALPRSLTLGRDLWLMVNAVMIGFAVVALSVFAFAPPLSYSRWLFVYLVPLTILLLGAGCVALHRVRHARWQRGLGVRNLLVVGATDAGVRLMRMATANATLGYKVVGFVDDRIRYSDWTIPARYGNSIKRSNAHVPHLGTIAQFGALIAQHQVDEVCIALPSEDYPMIRALLAQCRTYGVAYSLVPDMLEMSLGKTMVQEVNGLPLILDSPPPMTAAQYTLKTAFDIAGALLILLVAALPMAAIALAIVLDSRGPVIFRQTRVGKNGVPFTCFKFRSMYVDAEARVAELAQFNQTQGVTFKMVNDPRVTRVGRFIRRTSLDELPQLFNVVLRQMSLVGPRPGLPREVARYQKWQLRRLAVMPGMTGLWQVNGRSAVSFEEMVKMDIYYAEHWTLGLDIAILSKTVRAVLKADGAY